METDEVQSREAPMKTWLERGDGIVLTDDMNGFKDGGDWDEA